MSSSSSDIALVDEGGLVKDHKPKYAVSEQDIYNSIFVLLITPQKQVVLSEILTDDSEQLSATAVTVRHYKETPEQAAQAIAEQASGQHGIKLYHLGDHFYTSPTGRKIYISVFYGSADLGQKNNNCQALTADQLDTKIAHCTPALKSVWQTYRHLLPI